MKDVTYLAGIRRNPEVLLLAEQATARLEEIVKSFAPIISAEWDLTDERLRPEVCLRIEDDEGSVTACFQPRELSDSEHIGNRLRRLWDDLLGVRFRAIQKRLEAMVQQLEGD